MALFILIYDQRATQHDYSSLYQLLNSWGAAQLLNSVWLVESNDAAADIRSTMLSHMHRVDGVAVIQLRERFNNHWAAINCHQGGVAWLKARYP